jgi:hypothetical protein
LSTPDSAQAAKIEDDEYLKIWEVEQSHVKTRWTATTYFLTVSFAIFGFSFQSNLHASLALATRITGLAIYWFAFLMFWRFHAFTDLLREYLVEMEKTGRTAPGIQTRSRRFLGARYQSRFSAKWLLAYFGFLYALSIIFLWFMNM